MHAQSECASEISRESDNDATFILLKDPLLETILIRSERNVHLTCEITGFLFCFNNVWLQKGSQISSSLFKKLFVVMFSFFGYIFIKFSF